MNNRRYYSFERNNYFYGKLLTSRDFEDEQNYMNNKRRLINRVLHGAGIVYGLDVVAVDESSVVIQSGLALDSSGREIVVPSTQVVKLSTIRGYSDLKTSSVCLGIAYAEEKTEPVYAVMNKDADAQERQYNHLKEGYELFLQDSRDCVREPKKEDEYIAWKVLYQDDDLRITQYLPTFAVPGMLVKARTEIHKTSHMPFVCSFSCKVDTDGMIPGETQIRADNVSQEYGETMVLEQTFRPEDYIFGNGDVSVRFSEITVQKSGVKEAAPDTSMTLNPVYGTALEYVHKTSYRGNLDVDLDRKYDEKLWIAGIQLIRSERHSIIDRVERAPFDQYVYSSEQLMILEKLEEFLIPQDGSAGRPQVYVQGNSERSAAAAPERRSNSSGVFEMSLGSGGEVGKVYFSDEIMHGLGNGPVYVDIGIEYISRDVNASGDRESIILGDGSIFESDSTVTDEKIFQVDQAVKILPDRGTFIVGVRPRVKMGRIGLRIRWYAFKPEDLEQRVYDRSEQKGCIMIQPDTIVLPPKGSVHINPVFINMPEEALSYTLLDPEGGKIDNTGLYTAPAQEGVYEIKAAALSDPEIFTHAFIIVSQKKTEE
ncbi:hypothetical protein B5F29_07495 [Lachnoclostridium sp. An196]|uniref:hypothetical protein n=1 Tax=Lachnoclostridium sp. An196 TaxID=1965583 RepID=UPI000B3749D3|nr:hypothetical protein [Lachnoclostridium sp. An196]OUP19816.1 hypothetical protein B5F29_07495 [Lachnoclostridium sp. An196]